MTRASHTPPTMKLSFDNDHGETLAAHLDTPADGAPIAYALFAHCFTCSKNLRAVGHISRALCRRGIAVLRFDFTGLGESEGDFADTNFSSNVGDLVAAARFLEAEYEAPAVLVGHSLGGAAVLLAAGQIESAKAVATIAAPADPAHVKNLLTEALEEIEGEGEAQVALAGRPFTIKKQFLRDLDAPNMHDAIRGLGRALLAFHGPLDNTVGIENATKIFKSAKHPKSFVSLDEADHLLSNEADAQYVGAVAAAWASRYVGESQAVQKATAADDNRVTARTGPGGLRTEVVANGHALVADEPTDVPGGANTGPTPYDYLAAALGACTSMTLRMYADRKEWPLEEAITHVRHAKIYAEDCAHCDTQEGKLDRLERRVEATGDLTDEQRQRLVEIANKCPVHRTLEGEIDVVTSLADGE